MRCVFSSRAEKQLKKLSKISQIAVAKKISLLRNSKNVSNVEKLKSHKNIFRIRVGDYRIVFKKTKKEIHIVLVGHRKDIYKLVDRLFK